MSQPIVLFHSALGLRPALRDFAARLRAAGHVVHTPDLFDDAVFDSLEAGARKRDSLGIPELMRRAGQAVANLPPELIYAGFSMGAAAAEFLAATRSGAKGAILMSGAVDPAKSGIKAWPRDVGVQVHYAQNDPGVDVKDVSALANAVKGAGGTITVYTYRGSGHLFMDQDLNGYNADASWLMTERLLEFLARIDLSERETVETAAPDREVARSLHVDTPLPRPRVQTDGKPAKPTGKDADVR
jgi:dienelactone hydrolase